MTEPTAAVDSGAPYSFNQQVGRIIRLVTEGRFTGGMSRGDRAELRRMRQADAFPPEPFWRIVEECNISPRAEAFWRDVIPLMVDHPDNRSLRPGRALAKASVSAPRVERWLRRNAATARKEAGRLLTRLDEGLDWHRFARLLRDWDDRQRSDFARDFFLSPEYRQRKRELQRQEKD